jgi:ParB family chromosome partitioning protein
MSDENAKKTERRGLGRGLSALLADIDAATGGEEGGRPRIAPDRTLPIDSIRPNPAQPRRHFDEAELDDLAGSIRARGLLQPVIVRPDPGDPAAWQIVAGERRWRAAMRAGLHDIPVLVRDLDDMATLEVAIIENVQRADLNPMEEAAGYRQLMDRFGHTQERLAEAVGRSRSHLANMLRLTTLPMEVQEWVREGRLSAGHARALVGSPDAVAQAREVIRRGLSVRQTERMVKRVGEARATRPAAGRADPDRLALEADLSAQLGLKVAIHHRDGTEGGEIRIAYGTLDELDRLCRVLSRTAG